MAPAGARGQYEIVRVGLRDYSPCLPPPIFHLSRLPTDRNAESQCKGRCGLCPATDAPSTPAPTPSTSVPTPAPTPSPTCVDAAGPVCAMLVLNGCGNPNIATQCRGSCDNCLTESPTALPTTSPTTPDPTTSPTTSDPTTSPTASLTTSDPTVSPTSSPTTSDPTVSPSVSPTTSDPTSSPTTSPTASPTASDPTVSPTSSPTTSGPTTSPTVSPSASPTTSDPTVSPSVSSTTSDPTTSPTISDPTTSPTTSDPTTSPTASPTTSEPVVGEGNRAAGVGSAKARAADDGAAAGVVAGIIIAVGLVLVLVVMYWQRRKQQRAQRPVPRLPRRSSYEESDDGGDPATAAHKVSPCPTPVWLTEVSSAATASRAAMATDTSVRTAAPGSPADHIGVPRKAMGRIDSFITLDDGNNQISSSPTDGNMPALEPDTVTPEGAVDPIGQYVDVKLRKREGGTDRKGKHISIDLSKTEEHEQSRVSYTSVA